MQNTVWRGGPAERGDSAGAAVISERDIRPPSTY